MGTDHVMQGPADGARTRSKRSSMMTVTTGRFGELVESMY